MVSLGRRSVGKWLVVVLAAMGAVTGYVLSGLSADYRSQARIQVVPQRVSDDIVPASPPGPLESRLETMSQAVLSRTRLERLMMDLNLYERERATGAVMQDIIEQMRRDISIGMDPSGQNASGFVVSFTSKDPRVAQKVTEKLASLFIDQRMKEGERRAENTSEFLQSQIEETGRRLAEHDERMAVARASGRDVARLQVESEVIRGTYKTLLEKRELALMRVNMERRQISEQFVLLEQARIPERPVGPTRRTASVAGAIAGLGLAMTVNLLLAVRRRLAARAAVAMQT
jgi:uncharacterized protein involved in exopolysaccharide biosynthesis